jgi:hypothetical protein
MITERYHLLMLSGLTVYHNNLTAYLNFI